MNRTCYNSLWIGAKLGAVERACLLSILRQGHPVRLWCYSIPEDVPPGVRLADAAKVLPATSIIRHRDGSPALFANRFRYELQRSGAGPWIDCDMYLLRAIPDVDCLLAPQDDRVINPSVLRLPSDCPIIPPLLEQFEEKRVPGWISLPARAAAYWRLATTGRTGLSLMPWGSAGPHAITALARKYGLAPLALPARAFHPVHWRHADWIRDPAVRVEDVVGKQTIGIHLWNERIKHFKDQPAAADSFLSRLQAESAAAV